MDADSPHFAHAFEDLPEEARQQAAEIARTQPGISLRRRIMEELETFGLDSYGTLEQCRLLRFLSRYPVTAYTYPVSELVSRGRAAGRRQAGRTGRRRSVRATINLCAEMPDGDAPAIAAAGLAGRLQTTHIPVTDMESPTVAQLTELMDLLSGPDGAPTYVHCEAGKGRTGVAIACYRMAVTGWGIADALTEAVNFGCIVPGQQAFIREFGETLRAPRWPAGTRWCRSAPSARRRPSCRRPSAPRRTPRDATREGRQLLPSLLSHRPLPWPTPLAKLQTFSSNRYAQRARVDNLGTGVPPHPCPAQRCPRDVIGARQTWERKGLRRDPDHVGAACNPIRGIAPAAAGRSGTDPGGTGLGRRGEPADGQ